MTNLLTLATQIEQATEDQQREMLEAAWHEIHRGGYGPEGSWDTCRKCDLFKAMLDAKAYESAAMILMCNKVVLISLSEVKGDGMPLAIVGNPGTSELFECVADTMALALAAACCRAVAQREPHNA